MVALGLPDPVDTVAGAVAVALKNCGTQPGDRLLVAVSGGLDSMVLLDVLARMAPWPNRRLQVLHFDHGLRPDADLEARLVVETAAQYGVAVHRGRGDTPTHARRYRLSIEAAARQLRYRFFEACAGRLQVPRVALAHHGDDQAETFLLKMMRGSGSGGLGSMRPLHRGRYLRPLLSLDRQRLAAYAQARGVVFWEDPSNADRRFRRNRLRHDLLPRIRRDFNPRIAAVLQQTARILGDEDAYLQQVSQTALAAVTCCRSPHRLVLAVRKVLDYHISIQRRIARAALYGLSRQERAAGSRAVGQFLEMLHQTAAGPQNLPGGLLAQKAGGWLIVRRQRLEHHRKFIKQPGVTALHPWLRVRTRVLPAYRFEALRPGLGCWRAVFDARRIGRHLEVRGPRPGDRMAPLGMEGSKKLSDLLIDGRWPRLLRHEACVFTRRDEIVWVAGLRQGQAGCVRPQTDLLLLIELEGQVFGPGPPFKESI